MLTIARPCTAQREPRRSVTADRLLADDETAAACPVETTVVPLELPPAGPPTGRAILFPPPAVVDDPRPLQRLVGSTLGRGTEDRVAAGIHAYATAYDELERYWRARTGQATDTRDPERERAEAESGAVMMYTMVVRNHPTYARMDQVLLAFGDLLERSGHPDLAVRVYRRLADQHTSSTLASIARLAAAEIAYASGDPRAARRLYREVSATEPDPAVRALARYGLGWTQLALGDPRAALRSFERAAQSAADAVDERRAWLVRDHALVGIAVAFAAARTAEPATSLVRRVARSDRERDALRRALVSALVAGGRARTAESIVVDAHLGAARSTCEWVALLRSLRARLAVDAGTEP